MSRKHLTKLFYAKLNVLLGAVFTMLGFNNCDSIFNGEYLYGSPYAKFDVKGTVTDSDGKSLESVNVTTKEVVKEDGKELYAYEIKTTSTDTNGRYQQQGSWSGYPDENYNTLRVVVTDPNGVYAPDSVEVKLTRTAKDRDAWCEGTDVGTADFRLKRLDDKE